jgi:bifunctional N-acetylglucosamine-1-phosphate-uridyltransferase/glucosamine-1-phosphate-acetyltransferase GlmU-like protein
MLPQLFDSSRIPSSLQHLFEVEAPWLTLKALDLLLAELDSEVAGDVHPSAVLRGSVRIEAGARVGPAALIEGPAWLMAGAEVGHAAMLRGGVLMAPGSRVGHSSEAKRSLLLGGASMPHFNYAGDSILGHDVNLGAGVKLANLRVFGGNVRVEGHDTGMRKLGSIIGDGVSIGCNAVLAPGTVVGRESIVYDGVHLRGVIPERSVVKLRSDYLITPRR